MTDLHDAARVALRDLLVRSGRGAVEDPRRIKALLADALPEYRTEVAVLSAALDEGLVSELYAQSTGASGSMLTQLATRLERARALSPDAARWAIDSWSFALGIESTVPVPPPIATPIPPPAAPTAASGWGQPPPPQYPPPYQQQPPPPVRKGMSPLIPILAGLGVLVAVVAAIIIVNPFGAGDGTGVVTPSPTVSPTPSAEVTDSPSPTPSPTPTGEVDEVAVLLSHIPLYYGDCEDAPDAAYTGATATVRCEPGGAADFAYFDQFESRAAMDDVIDAQAGDAPVGDCGTSEAARDEWRYGEGRNEGEVVCYVDTDGWAWLTWSHYDSWIIATAARLDGDTAALHDWWIDAEPLE